MAAGSGALPECALRVAVLRRLSECSDQLNNMADLIDQLSLVVFPPSFTNPGVDDAQWTAYVDAEVQAMREDGLL